MMMIADDWRKVRLQCFGQIFKAHRVSYRYDPPLQRVLQIGKRAPLGIGRIMMAAARARVWI